MHGARGMSYTSILISRKLSIYLSHANFHTGKMGENPSLGLLFQMRSRLLEGEQRATRGGEQRATREGEQRASGVFGPLGVTKVTNKNLELLPQSRLAGDE